ncbi:pyocin knob domain-containing protein, partial [Corynebacterium sp. HMSC11D10]|uniref:pyocin knob domain-containing protein n=1 Tax=Corynebacterium sp. HMSC11D10 TaxID=1581088 RepID=UPI00143AFEAD
MAVTLSGTLADVTTSPIETTTSVTVKAPAIRPDGSQVTTTKPQQVKVAANGAFSITVVPGVGWLYIDGDGWSDTIRFVAAEGMTTMWQAIVNALPVTGDMRAYLESLNDARAEVRKALDDALKTVGSSVDKAVADRLWEKGTVAQGMDLNTLTRSGFYAVPSNVVADSLKNAPADLSARTIAAVTVKSYGSAVEQVWSAIHSRDRGDFPVYRRTSDTYGNWSAWVPVSPHVVNLPAGANPLALGVGSYSVATQTIAESISARPSDVDAWGAARVEVTTGPGGLKFLTWESMQPAASGRSGIWRRQQDSSGTWSDWRRLDQVQTIALGGTENLTALRDGEYLVQSQKIAETISTRPADTEAWGPSLVTVKTGAAGNRFLTWESMQPAASG